MDKTADDWKGFRTADKAVNDELHTHAKSNATYLQQQAFLAQAGANEYEAQKAGRSGAQQRGKQ